MARICTVDTGIEEGLCWMHLVDEAVVDDGAADLLVQLVQRLHLVHRNSQQPHAEKHLSPQ